MLPVIDPSLVDDPDDSSHMTETARRVFAAWERGLGWHNDDRKPRRMEFADLSRETPLSLEHVLRAEVARRTP